MTTIAIGDTVLDVAPGTLSASESRLLGRVRPELAAAYVQMRDQAWTTYGYVLAIPADGGTRTNARQQQLYADSLAQGGGTLAYPVATPGKSRHEYGAALDADIVAGGQASDGTGTDADYANLAAVSRSVGLMPGYDFSRKDVYHHQLNESLAQSIAAWQSMAPGGSLLQLIAVAAAIAALAVAVVRR